MKRKPTLRLYVWEGVLTDWRSGIMFALARSPDHARELILKKMSPNDDLRIEPRLVTEPEGFYIYGSS